MPRYEFDEEQRRQKREAARKKREAENRRLKRNLLLAAVVLALCGMVIFRLTQEVKVELNEYLPQKQEAVQEEKPKETTKPTTPVQKDPITTIHIKAAGDLNVTDNVVNAGSCHSGGCGSDRDEFRGQCLR